MNAHIIRKLKVGSEFLVQQDSSEGYFGALIDHSFKCVRGIFFGVINGAKFSFSLMVGHISLSFMENQIFCSSLFSLNVRPH